MLGKIIISILFIPVNALILWVVSGIVIERESYKKALFAASLLFLIFLLHHICFQGHGFYGRIEDYFLGSWYFIALLSSLVLWLIYRYDWNLFSFSFMFSICFLLYVSFNVIPPLILDMIL